MIKLVAAGVGAYLLWPAPESAPELEPEPVPDAADLDAILPTERALAGSTVPERPVHGSLPMPENRTRVVVRAVRVGTVVVGTTVFGGAGQHGSTADRWTSVVLGRRRGRPLIRAVGVR